MTLQWTPYTLLLLIIAAVPAVSGLYVWWRQPTPGKETTTWILLANAAWMLGHALELSSVDVQAKDFWNKVQYIGIVSLPTVWLIFTLHYTGRDKWLTRRTLAALSVVPFLTLLLVFTNGAHGLIWQRVGLAVDDPSSLLSRPHGPGYWFHAVYSLALLTVTIGLLVRSLTRSRHLYRRQISVFLIAVCLPLVANASMQLELNPFPYLDLTLWAVTLSNLILVWSFFQLRVGDIVPVARSAVIESMSDGVITLDERNRIIDLNPAAQQMIGHATSEVIGQPVEQAWPEWVQVGHLEGRNEAAKEVLIGSHIYDLRISPLTDWRGHLVSRVIVLRDITHRKRAEQKIRERRKYLEGLLAAAPDAIITLDAEHCVVEWNPGAEELFQYTAQEAIGQFVDDLITDPQVLEEAVRFSQMAARGEQVGPVETVRYRRDGTPVDVLLAGSPIFTEQKLIGVVVVYTDITGRKRMEKALREAHDQLDATLNALPDLLFEIDRQGRICDFRVPDPDLLYTFPAEFLGKRISEVLPDAASRVIMDAVQKAVETGRHAGVVYELETPAGPGWFELSIASKGDPPAPDGRMIALVRDVTERIQAEEQLRRHAIALQARNEELDAFAHTVAHDLKNPLGLIVGFAEALEEAYGNIPEQETRQFLRTIAQQGRKMDNIVNELLLLAQVRQAEVEMQPLDMESIVAEAHARLAYLIKERQAEIILPASWPVALGYGPWIEEVWVNYLSNGIKYGGDPPRLVLGATTEAGGAVRFWVEDNGPGLTPQEQARLFKPFEKLSQVRATGHGLGLSIVRRIVERLGGQVGIESRMGQGSVFSFTLPGRLP